MAGSLAGTFSPVRPESISALSWSAVGCGMDDGMVTLDWPQGTLATVQSTSLGWVPSRHLSAKHGFQGSLCVPDGWTEPPHVQRSKRSPGIPGGQPRPPIVHRGGIGAKDDFGARTCPINLTRGPEFQSRLPINPNGSGLRGRPPLEHDEHLAASALPTFQAALQPIEREILAASPHHRPIQKILAMYLKDDKKL
jgi:hypothetical protein